MFSKAFAAPLAALSLIAAAIPAGAAKSPEEQNGSAARSDNARTDNGKAERKICKRFENSASRMGSIRLCLTQAQWREFEQAREI